MFIKKKREIESKKNTYDYNTYKMSKTQIGLAFAAGAGLCGLVIFLFFRSPLMSAVGGVVAGFFGIKVFNKMLLQKTRKDLLMQFKDLLESLAASYSAGKNNYEAFFDSLHDMINIHGESSMIVREVQYITNGLDNNFVIEDLLDDLAERSGLDDIGSFADVFRVCNRQGADIKRVMAETRAVINEKIEQEQKIEALLMPGKRELYTLIVMPLIILLVLNSDSALSIASNTGTNLIVKTICIGIFALAFYIGRRIVNIKL